jgi:class 3 adenylate cyclase
VDQRRVRGGRSTAIILFTDLVGSTALRSRVGEDAAEEVRRTHDDLLAEAVAANRGRLVKNLGDGVMATFSGASDAVAAAVRIQQVIDRHNRAPAGGIALRVRIGISAGDVIVEEADCFGTPVIEAARLCAAAAGGQILVTEIVRLLAGSASGQEFSPVGALELKGLPAAVFASEVVWEAVAVSAIPPPALLTDLGQIFVGREEQLQRLGQLWKEAAAGARRVALLAGEPGVGKTRLAAELARRAHDEGATLLAGRCDEDLGVPYQPFVEALRHFLDHAPREELGERLGRYGGELTRLVPELQEMAPDLPPPLQSDPETERYRLFDAVAGWLKAVSAEGPLLLVLDDLQWAAKPTLLLLRHVVRALAHRVLIVGTYRDTELTHGHPLVEVIADLRRDRGLERISLSGLDGLGVTALVEQASGETLTEDGISLARAIYEETEGNPFFVHEVLRHLVETGAVARHEGSWATRLPVEEMGIPEGVLDVVGRRLARLSPDTHQALRVAAVAGTEFELDVLQVAGSLDEDTILWILEEGARTRLVIETSATRYRFSHALVRATLYDSLSAARKVTLHRKVAQAIETVHGEVLDDYLPALAHHWARASAPVADTARAIEYATRAGHRALAQLAHDEAVAYYRQALELSDAADAPAEDPQRLELLISLGEAQRRAGDAAHRDTLLQAARIAQSRGDAQALARAALANFRGFWSVTAAVDAERIAALEAALGATDAHDSPLRARLLAHLAAELHFSNQRERRRALSDDALAMARRLGDPPTLAHVVLARCAAIWEAGTAAERLANTEEILTASDAIRDPAIITWTWVWRFIAAADLANRTEADRSLKTVGTLTGELGQPTLRWVAAYLEAGWLLLAGRLGEAEEVAGKARELGVGAGQPDAPLFFALQRFHIGFHRGRLDELVGRAARGLDERPNPNTQALLALVYSESDQHGDASRVWETLVPQLPGMPVTITWLEATVNSAAVCAHLGDRAAATMLLDLLLPYEDYLAGMAITWAGCVSYYLGLLSATLARFEEADSYFTAASAAHARLGAPIWLARTQLEWARMLIARGEPGDAERARELLEEALTSARELGLANIERRAVELL